MASSLSFPAVRARFGRFELDLSSRELSCEGARVPIQDKPLQILRLLLEADGQVVSREQIRSALWPEDTFVDFEHGVNTAIKKLRHALEDSAENPQYVETLPRVGYRFLTTVEWLEEASVSRKTLTVVTMPSPAPEPLAAIAAQPEPRRSYWKSAGIGAGLVLILLLVGLSVGHRNFLWRMWGLTFHRAGVSSPQAKPSSIKRRRLTANPEEAPVSSAVISPDGKYFAYSDSTGLFLKLVDSGETHPLPLPATFTPAVESWFPDSVHLVVSWVEDSRKPPGLWVTSVLGGSPRKLTDVGSYARVSPDGSQIAFLRGPWDDNEIWLMDSNGNDVRKLVDAGMDYFGPVAWSPDGLRFAAVRASIERPESQILVYEIRTGRAESIFSVSGLGPDILWTASARLLFTQGEAPPNQDNSNIWSVQRDVRTGRLAGSAIRITDDRDRVGSISVSSDGTRLVTIRYSLQGDVFLTTIEQGGKRLSPLRRFTLDQREDFPSSWTPDSSAVLIVSNRDGISHIFKQKVDQTQPELFVGGSRDVWLPHMAPDGVNMLYLASAGQVGPSDKVRLMSISLEGGPSRMVLEGPGIVNYQCARFPSMLCVYGKVEPDYYRFYSFDPSGGGHTELPIKMRKGSAVNNWNLSPDGKYLAISETQNPYEGPRLRVISLADNRERLLSPSELKLIIGIDWAADSKSLWLGGFMGRSSWTTRSGLINLDLNGRATVVIEGQAPMIMGGTPSPDARRLALGANTFSSNVWLLENP